MPNSAREKAAHRTRANVANDKRNALHVGVTGHRILTDFGKLHKGIEKALELIERAYPGRRLVVLSSLAEGADRLVVHHALRRADTGLIVPLPFAVEDYMTDFQSESSKAEFLSLLERAETVVEPPQVTTRNEAYAAAGHYIADHCSVLLALWDGLESQGKGGTAEIVARARMHKKPVIIVSAGNRKPGTQEPTSLGPEQGRVITERMGETRE